ncbi:MAG: nickel pincer cofactor biosynthesis protein LarC [Terriglobales bacterium]
MRLAYLDCSSGISGDMLLAAALAAGVDLAPINRAVASLGIDLVLETETVERNGVQALRLLGRTADGRRGPLGATSAASDAHEHGHSHAAHEHGPAEGVEHAAPERAQEGHGAPEATRRLHLHPPPRAAKSVRKSVAESGEASHPHVPVAGHGHSHGRTLKSILTLLDRVRLSPAVTARARAAFQALGEAEAKVHGVSIETIHFHEVGQDDAIVDVVGAAMAFEALGVERVISSPLNLGSGEVVCAHGRFSIPAPATLELVRGLPVYSDGRQAELVTPTGAALIRTLAQGFGPMPAMRPEHVGYGAGHYELDGLADVLRLVVGREQTTVAQPRSETAEWRAALGAMEPVVVLEATVDDMNPEFFGHLVEQGLAAGALDVYAVPAQMKKSRPGLLLTLLARPADAARLTQLLLAETTTLGVRVQETERVVLERSWSQVATRFGAIRVKVAGNNAHPEFEDCRAAAQRHGVPLKQVYLEALRAWGNEEQQTEIGS